MENILAFLVSFSCQTCVQCIKIVLIGDLKSNKLFVRL